jgi:hypothetical protein
MGYYIHVQNIAIKRLPCFAPKARVLHSKPIVLVVVECEQEFSLHSQCIIKVSKLKWLIEAFKYLKIHGPALAAQGSLDLNPLNNSTFLILMCYHQQICYWNKSSQLNVARQSFTFRNRLTQTFRGHYRAIWANPLSSFEAAWGLSKKLFKKKARKNSNLKK